MKLTKSYTLNQNLIDRFIKKSNRIDKNFPLKAMSVEAFKNLLKIFKNGN